MKITLNRINDALHFEGKTEDGLTSHFDSNIMKGGNALAPSPMQHVLMSVAACSSIDVVLILEKMRQKLVDIQVEVEGKRADTVPKVFESIHVHYKLFGDVKEKQAEKAIRLSMEQYCSVSLMLKKSVDITWSFEVYQELV